MRPFGVRIYAFMVETLCEVLEEVNASSLAMPAPSSAFGVPGEVNAV